MLFGVTGTGSPAAIALCSAVLCSGSTAIDAYPVADRRLDAADQPAAADGDDHGVDVGCVFLDLEADGALAGEHERVVERVHERPAGLFDEHVEPLRMPRRGRSPRGRRRRRSRGWRRSSVRMLPPTSRRARRALRRRRANATAWAWLPALIAITPRALSSALRLLILLSAPRTLKEPVRWKSSHLRRAAIVRFAEQRRSRQAAADRLACAEDVVARREVGHVQTVMGRGANERRQPILGGT